MHNRTNLKAWLTCSLFLAILIVPAKTDGKIIYVDANATGANNGSNWVNAYVSLQDALADANSVDKPVEIRVAEGIYKPDQGAGITAGDRTAAFQLINGATLKGGYAGVDEADPNARDIKIYETILSGDLAGNDVDVNGPYDLLDEPNLSENSYHVVTGIGADETATFEGFTIVGGSASDTLYPKSLGGAVFISAASPSISHCVFRNNTAIVGGAINVEDGRAELVDCTFVGNQALFAGGIKTSYHDTRTSLENCTFVENTAMYGGGAAICNWATLSHCRFVRNQAGSNGGAICNDCSAITLDHCMFIENTAPSAGGAIRNYEGYLIITYCTFIRNSADNGGAIYQGDTDTLLTGCWFIENTASTGGGITNECGSDPILTNCVFISNSADRGGGFYNTMGSAPELIGCTFSQNSATYGGGGIFNNHGYTLLVDCTFRGNSATYGAGLYNFIESNTLLKNCSFVANRAWEGGGAIYNFNSSPTSINCRFSGNVSAGNGAAICNHEDEGRCEPILKNCVLTGNSAAMAGGGMFTQSGEEQCRPVLNKCTFADNFASNGTAIACDSFKQRYPSEMVLTNCILWDADNEIWNNDGSIIKITYCDVKGGWTGQGNIDVDPCFAETGYWDPNGTPSDVNDDFWVDGDYHLKSQAGRWDPNTESWVLDEVTSPCVDAGNPGCPLGVEPNDVNNIRINMGTHGGTAEASKSPANWRNIADLTNDWLVDFNDLKVFVDYWLETGRCIPSDFSRNQSVDFIDLAIFCQQWNVSSKNSILIKR